MTIMPNKARCEPTTDPALTPRTRCLSCGERPELDPGSGFCRVCTAKMKAEVAREVVNTPLTTPKSIAEIRLSLPREPKPTKLQAKILEAKAVVGQSKEQSKEQSKDRDQGEESEPAPVVPTPDPDDTRPRCIVKDCDRPQYGREVCKMHYQRWRKGDAETVAQLGPYTATKGPDAVKPRVVVEAKDVGVKAVCKFCHRLLPVSAFDTNRLTGQPQTRCRPCAAKFRDRNRAWAKEKYDKEKGKVVAKEKIEVRRQEIIDEMIEGIITLDLRDRPALVEDLQAAAEENERTLEGEIRYRLKMGVWKHSDSRAAITG